MIDGNVVVDVRTQIPLYKSQRNTIVLKYHGTNVVHLININGVDQTLELLNELIDAYIYHHGDLQLMIEGTTYTFSEHQWIEIFKALDQWFVEYLYDKIDYSTNEDQDPWD